jgi:hypothetical protein
MQFASKNVLLMILVAFFLFVIGYNILGNTIGGLEGFREGATDNSKFTAQNITDIIRCADPNSNKSPYSSSDISDMLSGSSFTISGGKVTCSSDKKSDSNNSDKKSGDSISDSKNDKKSGDSSSDSKSSDSKSK